MAVYVCRRHGKYNKYIIYSIFWENGTHFEFKKNLIGEFSLYMYLSNLNRGPLDLLNLLMIKAL